MAQNTLRVGVFGAGTVGGGVVEILRKASSRLGSLGVRIEICKICVRSPDKERSFTMPSDCQLVADYDAILGDDSINCIVEVMGGVTDAKDVVFRAIQSGKHVVTANKALVASHLNELEQLLQQHPQVKFAYEAAVCGGIPIIHTLQTDYAADQVTSLVGIMNGTTNYMLSRMEAEGAEYGEVLEEAQALGYAEADPSADVDGLDVQAKICIATKLAFGVTVDAAQIPTIGIREVSSIDFEYAKTLNRTIKLLATARRLANGKLSVYVSPVLVPKTHSLANSRGADNLVHVTSQFLGAASYSGAGAGRFPTANSVVNDIIRIARGTCPGPFTPAQQWDFESDYVGSFYIRMTIVDQLGVIRRIGEVAERHGISIYAILQNPIVDPKRVDFVVTTDECRHSQVQAFVQEMNSQNFALERPFYMSIL